MSKKRQEKGKVPTPPDRPSLYDPAVRESVQHMDNRIKYVLRKGCC